MITSHMRYLLANSRFEAVRNKNTEFSQYINGAYATWPCTMTYWPDALSDADLL